MCEKYWFLKNEIFYSFVGQVDTNAYGINT